MASASASLDIGTDFQSLEFPTFRKFFVSLHDHFIPHARNNYHPHALSHRMLTLVSLLLMTVKIVSISLVALGPAAPAYSSEITGDTVITLANQARVAGGLGELRTSNLLARAAQNKANDMLAKQYFSHNTPDGNTPWTFIKAVGYSYITAGENLAIDFTEAESVQAAWMNSPGHKANIMNKNFEEIGIGIARGIFEGHQTTIVVQMFGTPIVQQVTQLAKPTPVAQAAPAPVIKPTQPVANNSVTPAPAVVQPTDKNYVEPLIIHDTNTALQGNQLYISVSASHAAVKLLALYGNQSVMLDPAGNDLWSGKIPLTKLSPYDNLVVQAYDMQGHIHQEPVVQFSGDPISQLKGNVEGVSVSVLGKIFNPKQMEQKVFLVILAALLTGLILAIAIRRHVQHVSLIANTSFVAMLAAILFMT